MAKKEKGLTDLVPFLIECYGEDRAEKVLNYAKNRFRALCMENLEDHRAVKNHTETDIYPCIAVYEGLIREGVSKEEAEKFLDVTYSRKAEVGATQMRMLCKIPGVYKLVPTLFRKVTDLQFGEKAGFHAVFLESDKNRTRFNMEKCLYCDRLQRYGYPELVKCFCHTDDVKNGAMHPKLCWARTKTMGEGGDVCDFDMYIRE